MLPKLNRLRHRADFKTVYSKGLHRKTSHLTLRAWYRSNRMNSISQEGRSSFPEASRIGISISQKVSKQATARNRIKRQIRSALRHLLPQFLPGWDVVVIVKPSAIKCNYAEFLQELEQLFREAELFNGDSRGKLL